MCFGDEIRALGVGLCRKVVNGEFLSRLYKPPKLPGPLFFDKVEGVIPIRKAFGFATGFDIPGVEVDYQAHGCRVGLNIRFDGDQSLSNNPNVLSLSEIIQHFLLERGKVRRVLTMKGKEGLLVSQLKRVVGLENKLLESGRLISLRLDTGRRAYERYHKEQ